MDDIEVFGNFVNGSSKTKTRVTWAILAALALALGLPLLAFNGFSFLAVAPFLAVSMVLTYSGLMAFYMSRLGGVVLLATSLLVTKTFWSSDLSWPLVALATILLLAIGQGVVAIFQHHKRVPKKGLKIPRQLRQMAGCAWIALVLQFGGMAFLAQLEMRAAYLDLSTNPVVLRHLGALEWVALDWFDLRRDRLVHLRLVGSKTKASAFVELSAENYGPKYLGTLKVSAQEFDLTPTLYVP